jgi:hypothetical protein
MGGKQMVNIIQPKKVDEGSNLSGLGTILGAIAGSFAGNPMAGASLGASLGGAAGGALSRPGSVEQAQGVQPQQNSAIGRRLLESSAPMQIGQNNQAPQNPEFEALRRRLMMG